MVVSAVKSVGSADLACRVAWGLLSSCSGLGTGSVILALIAAEVCRLLVLLIKGMFSQEVLVVWLAVLLDLFNGNQEVEYVKGMVMVKVIPQI